MGRVHEVLHWANRRAVAEEVTRRGYRVSGETLNRWVREGKEFPAVVERIVFDLFTISGHEESPPAWAEGLADRTAAKVIGALADPELLAALPYLLRRDWRRLALIVAVASVLWAPVLLFDGYPAVRGFWPTDLAILLALTARSRTGRTA